MLNYLPPFQNKWEEVLKTKREVYKQFIRKFDIFQPYFLN